MTILSVVIGASLLASACGDELEADDHPCGASEFGERYRSGVDATTRARIGTIEGDPASGVAFTPTPAGTDTQLAQSDFRYGAVYVENTLADPVCVRLWDSSTTSPATDTGLVMVDGTAGDNHLWMPVSDATTQVSVAFADYDDMTSSCGTEGSPTQVDIDPNTDEDLRSDVAGNVVSLNCRGVARWFDVNVDGRESTGAASDGGPLRNYVTVMDSRDLVIRNEIDDTTVRDPTHWCLWVATLADATVDCPEWASADTYRWQPILHQDSTNQRKLAPGDEWTQSVDELPGAIALGFTAAEQNASGGYYCPDRAPNPMLTEDLREVVRIADPQLGEVRIEFVNAGTVPVAVPFVVEAEVGGQVEVRNCTEKTVTYTKHSGDMAELDPDEAQSITFDPGAACTEHWHWAIGDDPTMVIKKRTDTMATANLCE